MKTTNLITVTTRRAPLPHPEPEASGGGSPPPPPPPPGPPPPVPNGGGDKWYSSYPDDVKQYVEKNAYPDPLAAIKSTMSLEKLVGVPADQVIRRPAQGFDVDPKPHLAALDVLGRPKESKAYIEAGVFAPVEGLGQLDETVQKGTADKFHQLGILPWQAKGLIEHFNSVAAAQKSTMDSAAAAAKVERDGRLDAYRAERGAKFDADVAGAKSVIAKFDKPLTGDIEQLKAKGLVRTDRNGVIVLDKDGNMQPVGEFEAFLIETGQGDDPRMIRMLAQMAERFDPSSLVREGGDSPNAPGAMSKQQAAERERALRADPAFMKQFTTRGDPGHKAAVDQMTELTRIQHS